MHDSPFRHIRQFRGTLGAANAGRFFESVVEDCDRVLALRILVEPLDGTDLQARAHGNEKLVLFRKSGDFGTELDINGAFRWEHGSWLVDGFYLVKPGGMFQGTCCFGLLPADEASIRLNPSVRIVPVSI